MAHHVHDDSSNLAGILDLEAEVLWSYHAELIDWIHGLATADRRILDIGCGTGTGALGLAERFPQAEVIAVDASAAMLERLRARAGELDLDHRVRTVQADLDQSWPDLEPVDLAWAANSLHHMTDPDRVIADIRGSLRPGGMLVVAEMDSFPRFLPDHVGPGLEERCLAAADMERAHVLPHMGSDWRARLIAAGFDIEAERHFTVDVPAPLPAAGGRFAQETLRRLRSGVAERLSDRDLAMLDELLDGDGPDSILRRDDLTVRAE
ncbi:MAG TPA: class I SAM-dependent methyltransferase, partial [Micromonosporaceae bacterium]